MILDAASLKTRYLLYNNSRQIILFCYKDSTIYCMYYHRTHYLCILHFGQTNENSHNPYVVFILNVICWRKGGISLNASLTQVLCEHVHCCQLSVKIKTQYLYLFLLGCQFGIFLKSVIWYFSSSFWLYSLRSWWTVDDSITVENRNIRCHVFSLFFKSTQSYFIVIAP